MSSRLSLFEWLEYRLLIMKRKVLTINVIFNYAACRDSTQGPELDATRGFPPRRDAGTAAAGRVSGPDRGLLE